MPNKVNFIICNLCLNKYDYKEINKDTKIPALKKKRSYKIANTHLITKGKHI